MKKLIITACILFACVAVQAQQQIRPVQTQQESKRPYKTTLEEYNYITKGYQIQVESGLDMKQGYEVYNVDSKTISNRSAELKCLIRTNTPIKEIACYFIVYKKDNRVIDYLCIPGPHSDISILNKYWNQIYDAPFSSEKLQLFTYLISLHMQWNYSTTFVEIK